MTLGSLFDGIGGFPLAASRNGIEPVWASEIGKAPVSITKRHFPQMRHLGDITKLNGAEIEPVDIITFGSPCQDLSVAGLRAGLEGERSGLFMQAVRIVKEMRGATKQTCPTRIVWENVPGAFSSNGGRDFQTVIKEIAGVAEEGISIPRLPSGWFSSGTVMGNNWSLAWRVLDAQYWGVPQRRRRIFLVADFTSRSAGEILFKPESGLGANRQGGTVRGAGAGNIENGVAEPPGASAETVTFICMAYGVYVRGDIGKTLLAEQDPSSGDLVVTGNSVRVLTPLEYERLQGYPDGWTEFGHDGKPVSDTQRYKALGNSVAIPCVEYVMAGMTNEK